jgi:hypothetical protein
MVGDGCFRKGKFETTAVAFPGDEELESFEIEALH